MSAKGKLFRDKCSVNLSIRILLLKDERFRGDYFGICCMILSSRGQTNMHSSSKCMLLKFSVTNTSPGPGNETVME